MFRLLAFLFLFAAVSTASALEKKSFTKVDTSQLVKETHRTISTEGNGIHLVWYIPFEFWEVSLAKKGAPNKDNQKILDILRPYFVVGVVQADISAFGATTFYPKSVVEKNLSVLYEDGHGSQTILKPIQPNANVEMLFKILQPIMGSALGNLGNNIQFFFFSDEAGNGRQVDPYKAGELSITLADTQGRSLNTRLDMPLNALYEPRICPNGKEAHVSWKYCPWNGERLSE